MSSIRSVFFIIFDGRLVLSISVTFSCDERRVDRRNVVGGSTASGNVDRFLPERFVEATAVPAAEEDVNDVGIVIVMLLRMVQMLS